MTYIYKVQMWSRRIYTQVLYCSASCLWGANQFRDIGLIRVALMGKRSCVDTKLRKGQDIKGQDVKGQDVDLRRGAL